MKTDESRFSPLPNRRRRLWSERDLEALAPLGGEQKRTDARHAQGRQDDEPVDNK